MGLDVGRNTHSYDGLDWVNKLVDWVGLDLEQWTHGHLCYRPWCEIVKLRRRRIDTEQNVRVLID